MAHEFIGVLYVVNFIRYSNMIAFVDMMSIKDDEKDKKKTDITVILSIIKELRALGWTCHNNHRGVLSWYRIGNYNKNRKYATQHGPEWEEDLKTAVGKAIPF